ncbi:MAG TPA: winged helix-turn-helix domain-containing protein [Pyrinomonadaceae bacterium]|nr:winged helix-turn-helix domain-containing protein [Pyrinomonadaceae bacterium]
MNEKGHFLPYFEFVNFTLYPEERLLLKNGERVPITPRVLDLLIVLVNSHGKLVKKEVLLESVWSDRFVGGGNINRAVCTLRKSLGVQPNGSDFIETVPKFGYRFIAPVQVITDAYQGVTTSFFRRPSFVISQAGIVLALTALMGWYLQP